MLAGLGMIPLAGLIFGALCVLLAFGLWIGFALPFIGLIAMTAAQIPAGPVLATTLWSSSSSWTMASLPLFIWMGEILFRSRVSEQMFDGLAPWMSRLPGQLLHVNVAGCGVFAMVSGSSAATCATVGKITLPELQSRGYNERMSLGSLAGASTLGFLIPPSVPMIVYAIAANVSVIQMFLAGFLPGLVVMVLYSGYIAIWSRFNRNSQPRADTILPFGERLRRSANLLPVLALVAFVFLAMVLGFATATECASWGVVGALILSASTRSLTWRNFLDGVMSATRMSVTILLIINGAAFTTAAMAYTGIPSALANWVNGFGLSPFMLLTILALMYVFLGMILEGISLIVLTTVVVLPMIQQAGFDLIWFGIFLIILVEMSQITPPVGFNLFVLQNMSGHDSLHIARAAFPFFLLLCLALVIIAVFPQIALWLPQHFYGR